MNTIIKNIQNFFQAGTSITTKDGIILFIGMWFAGMVAVNIYRTFFSKPKDGEKSLVFKKYVAALFALLALAGGSYFEYVMNTIDHTLLRDWQVWMGHVLAAITLVSGFVGIVLTTQKDELSVQTKATIHPNVAPLLHNIDEGGRLEEKEEILITENEKEYA